MRLERISAKNIRMHPSRVLLLLTGLVVAVATVVSLYNLSSVMNKDFQDKLDTFGSNMVIVPKQKNLPTTYSEVSVADSSAEDSFLREGDIKRLKSIRNSANLAHIAPKLIQPDTVNGRRLLIAGVRFGHEYRIKKWWRLAAGKRAYGRDQALLGARVARELTAEPSSKLTLGKRTFTVAGVLRPVGSQEDNLAYIDLDEAQSLYNKPDRLSLIEASAWCYNCPIEQIVGQASEKLPNAKVSAVLQASQNRNAVVDQFTLFAKVLSGVMIVVAALVVTTSLLSNVRERRREIGIFRSVGFRGINILEIILVETMILALGAGVLGYVLGVLVSGWVAPSLGLSGGTAYVNTNFGFNWFVAYFAVLGTVILAMFASIYPALKAASMNPADAINDI